MSLSNLNLMKKTKLNIVSKVFPVKKTEIISLDKLDIYLKEAKTNQIDVPHILSPPITANFCPVRPNLIKIETFPPPNEVALDFTDWLKTQLSPAEIESFSISLTPPKREGKSYLQNDIEDSQLTIFQSENDSKNCIHGLPRKWCSICIERERQNRERSSSRFDLFDLIFPMLQPPLGDNFDNPITLPLGEKLFPYQCEGVKFLIEHERALLGDATGIGKSIQAIMAIRVLIRTGEINNCLILCPITVLTDWEKKLEYWAPELRVVKVRGLKEQRQILWNSSAHIYLTNYETLNEDLPNSLKNNMAKNQFDLIILDEIQKIKNPGTDITKATRQIEANIRWGLSGTPLENHIGELISIFAYLKPSLLTYNDAAYPLKVKEAIKPYFLRRKGDVLKDKLPKVVYKDRWLDLLPSQRQTYDRAEQEGIVALNEKGDSITVPNILALITKLKQICNIDPVSKESCKLEYLQEKLDDISEDSKSLVVSQYPEKTLRFLEQELKRFSPLFYHGSLSDSQRDNIVNGFRKGQNKVLLMSVKAGGVGITLTEANYVFHFDQWWNPSVADQAEGRAHRIGQKKPVYVTYLFTENTIEEKIQNILKGKRKLFKSIIGGLSDTNLSKILTEEELFGLFNLKKPTKAKGITGNKLVTESLDQISPQQFEKLIANLYEKMGYQVKLTPPTRDHGVDIYAKRLTDIGIEYFAIQCKHYPKGVVGVEHARSLYGIIQAQPDITKGILVTTGDFSGDCVNFAKGKRIELFNGNYLKVLMQKYGISL